MQNSKFKNLHRPDCAAMSGSESLSTGIPSFTVVHKSRLVQLVDLLVGGGLSWVTLDFFEWVWYSVTMLSSSLSVSKQCYFSITHVVLQWQLLTWQHILSALALTLLGHNGVLFKDVYQAWDGIS